MKFDDDIPVFGDKSKRGKVPSEAAEQVTFFAQLRKLHPDLAAIALHPRNEGKRHYAQTNKEKSEGMNAGASDIIIPCNPPFVCELKRQDHTKSRWQANQVEYLKACKKQGAFVCVALGYAAALEALNLHLEKNMK